MKPRTIVLFLAAMAVLTLALVLWPRSKPRSVEQAGASSASKAVREGSRSFGSSASASPSAKPFRRPLIIPPPQPSPPAPTESRVNAAQVLATVNQAQIKLRDLMPVRPDETEKVLTPEQYAYRLQRAIEMELTFQAARDQGVELTAAQKQRVEQLAGSDKANLEHYKQYGLTWSSSNPEQVEFERRLLSAQMLEQNLVAKKATVSPSPNPETQARYEQARRELLDQLEARANITKVVSSL